MKTIGSRLREAIERRWGPRRIKTFHEKSLKPALDARPEIRGSSYATLHSYLGDSTVPTREWLEVAAELLDVPVEWLERGEVPEPDDRLYAWELGDGGRDEATIRQLAPGVRRENLAHRRALRRFSHKLADAETPESKWSNDAYRALLLGAAYRFLEEMEKAFAKALEFPEDADLPEEDAKILRKLWLPDRLALKESSSKGWQVTWTDAVLDLFARRIYGLGERAGGLYDTHARPNPLQIGDEQDTREGGTHGQA